ncbi:LLM class flavin-dependent oxidoreductase [Pseudonocardia saturnea]
MLIGYKLATEAFGPEEIIRQAVRAEQVGFDFVEMSDHFHPWLDVQGHSPFTWSVFGAIAARTARISVTPCSPPTPTRTWSGGTARPAARPTTCDPGGPARGADPERSSAREQVAVIGPGQPRTGRVAAARRVA